MVMTCCGTSTLIQGAGGDQVMLAFEGFDSHQASLQALFDLSPAEARVVSLGGVETITPPMRLSP
jgi:hypothetical protein